MVEEFSALNTRELEALRREALEETERRTGELSEEIQGASRDVEDFTSRMDDIEARWEEMDRETLAKVEEGHREILERSDYLERTDHSGACDLVRRPTGDVRVSNPHLASGDIQLPGHHVDEGSLARAVRSDKAKDLASP